jgi:hypothetical protein
MTPPTRRHFLQAASVVLPALLINCRNAPADAQRGGAGELHVADFRAPGFSDRQILERAFEAWARRGGTLHLEPGHIYDLGLHADGSNVFVVFGLEDAVLAGNGATLRLHSRGHHVFNILYLAHYRNLRIENLRCIDTGYRGIYQAGGRFIVLDAGQRDSIDVTFDNVVGERLVSFITAQGVPNGPRVRGIHIAPNCRAAQVFYAISCQNNGDDLTGGLSTFNCARSYYPYGVSNHRLALRIHHQGARHGPVADIAVPIMSYGRPTSRIRLDVAFSGTLVWGGACVALTHQHAPEGRPSVIEDIELNIVVEPGTTAEYDIPRLEFRNYLADGTPTTGRTANIWRRIRIGGQLRPGRAPAIVARIVPDAPPDITILPDTTGASATEIDVPTFRINRLRRGN